MRKVWLNFTQAVTVALGLLFVVTTLKPEWLQRSPLNTTTVNVASVPPLATLPSTGATGFRVAAQLASPAVVSVSTSKNASRSQQEGDPWFQFFFGNRMPQQQPQAGLGSGVIVSKDGFVLTNNHVVEGADDIEVALLDGRRATAKVVGTDPDTDLAVLKIELPELPSITLGSTEQIAVGDAVLAIGNPFGVGQTVTSGIVSALGRNQLGINTFENFIQTDAAINPGNSGGALVDERGLLIGINTAIYSRSGGNLGIGFAIPVNTAKQVMESLIADGTVKRGWIGVEPRDLTPEIAQSFNLPVKQGVLITGVLQNGPAGSAGLRPGDVVTQVADMKVVNTAQLLAAVAAIKPQTEASFAVQRGAEKLSIKITVAQRPKAPANRQR
ncbi:MAG: trypsin-like peptidase domain-containing protein [Burkholderiaceae bacterium]